MHQAFSSMHQPTTIGATGTTAGVPTTRGIPDPTNKREGTGLNLGLFSTITTVGLGRR